MSGFLLATKIFGTLMFGASGAAGVWYAAASEENAAAWRRIGLAAISVALGAFGITAVWI